MRERIDRQAIYRLQPTIASSLRALGEAPVTAGLDKTLLELVKLRASQLNGCAFCLNMHSVEARKLGEDQLRLDLVAAWREAPCFNERERAALAWTEALTALTPDHVPDDVYAMAKASFSDEEFVNLTAAVVAINSWNRIAVAFRFAPSV
ncbi:MAG TPA: carboxymuconolactone decarboxylase family protein [Stellaceae bacterium]|nr:carboxymuconolactone decarboxylase family protein [Stellaceae bacterium]